MKERIEDLGYCRALIEQALAMELFNEDGMNVRPKDFVEWFDSLNDVDKGDFLHDLPYKIRCVKEMIYKVLDVLKGEDYLNQPVYTKNEI